MSDGDLAAVEIDDASEIADVMDVAEALDHAAGDEARLDVLSDAVEADANVRRHVA